jgi:ABC-type uncharacterized transport system substrate-binding protein
MWKNPKRVQQAIKRFTKEIEEIEAAIYAPGDDDPLLVAGSGDAPGGNITGSTGSTSEMTQKCLELLHEALPDARRIGVLINPPDPFSRYFLKRATSAAARLGLQINPLTRLSQLDSGNCDFRVFSR